MPTPNYVLLGEVTLTETTSFITFSSIPQSGYTDLKLVASVRALRTGFPADDLVIQFNGVTSGYTGRRLYATSTSISTDTPADIRGFASDADQTTNVFGSNEFHIHNYLSSSFKAVSIDFVTENNAADAPLGIFNGLWSNTAAITTIKVFCNNSNMVAGSTFYLYGLAAVGTTPTITPYATGGDIITKDSTYWYHAFLSSGTFTTSRTLSADCLVVAGGGGGNSGYGGGGGAGGLLVQTGRSLAPNQYVVAIGAGGRGSDSAGMSWSGTNSSFDGIIALGGGAGSSGALGIDGGSGGGGGMAANGSPGYNGGAATQGNSSGATGYGFAGGAGIRVDANAQYKGGGGGGAGGAGATATANSAGAAGGIGFYNAMTTAMGLATSTGVNSSSNYYYAGGGASNGGRGYSGGTGGTGGGGRGSDGDADNATVGTPNTGGGGGGGWEAYGGGKAGGSGIVIIRYPIA